MAWMWENVKKEQERCSGWVVTPAWPLLARPTSGPLVSPSRPGKWTTAPLPGFDGGSSCCSIVFICLCSEDPEVLLVTRDPSACSSHNKSP